jgi:hypothetical protein
MHVNTYIHAYTYKGSWVRTIDRHACTCDYRHTCMCAHPYTDPITHPPTTTSRMRTLMHPTIHTGIPASTHMGIPAYIHKACMHTSLQHQSILGYIHLYIHGVQIHTYLRVGGAHKGMENAIRGRNSTPESEGCGSKAGETGGKLTHRCMMLFLED